MRVGRCRAAGRIASFVRDKKLKHTLRESVSQLNKYTTSFGIEQPFDTGFFFQCQALYQLLRHLLSPLRNCLSPFYHPRYREACVNRSASRSSRRRYSSAFVLRLCDQRDSLVRSAKRRLSITSQSYFATEITVYIFGLGAVHPIFRMSLTNRKCLKHRQLERIVLRRGNINWNRAMCNMWDLEGVGADAGKCIERHKLRLSLRMPSAEGTPRTKFAVVAREDISIH